MCYIVYNVDIFTHFGLDLSSFEKHKFDSRRKRSMMYKIAFGQFLITAAVLFVQTQVIDQIPGIIPYIKVIVERTVFYYTLV